MLTASSISSMAINSTIRFFTVQEDADHRHREQDRAERKGQNQVIRPVMLGPFGS